MKIKNVKINHFNHPLGYVLDPLTISWLVEGNEEESILGSRIIIALDKMMKKIVYDTDYTELNHLGERVDLHLNPYTRYFVKVEAKDANNTVYKSNITFFETAKQSDPWQGEWIKPDVDYSPIIYSNFQLDAGIKKARLYICGVGIYEVYINHRSTSEEYLLPGYHAYDAYMQYQTFDVTQLLVEKKNLIEIWLGNGWYKGRFSFTSETNLYGDSNAVIFELHIEYNNGTRQIITSNEKMLVKECPVDRNNNIYDGETYYANRENSKKKDHVQKINLNKSLLTERYSLPIVKMGSKKPKLIITPKGEKVLDFKQNMTGWVEFDAKEDITLTYGEILQDGNFYHDNYRSAKAEYKYIGDGKVRHVRPHFTFYGFQYVKVETEAEIDPSQFIAYSVYSRMDTISSFKSGNSKINQLVSNALWSQKDNFLDVPTDCPQRDERMGWTGDAQIFSATACKNMDTNAFYAKYLKDVLEEQKKLHGGVPYVVPKVEYSGKFASMNAHSASPWGDVATIIPWNVYEAFGDKSALETHYENMKMWTDYITSVDEENGHHYLWTTGFHFADWLALDNYQHPDNPMGGTEPLFVASCFYYYSAKLTMKAARVLGFEDDYEYYKKLAKKIKKAIQNEYITPSGRCAIHTQTALVLLLFMDLFKKEQVQRNVDELVKMIHENNNHFTTGFVGTPYLCHVLSKYNHNDLAYDLLLNEDYPGWLYEVKMGATTIWERWNSVMEDGHMNPDGMNSLNHYAYGAIVDWIYQQVCGLVMIEPGYTKFKIAPHIDPRIGKMDYSYASASGKIEIHWNILENDQYSISVTVPFMTSATIELPESGKEPFEVSSGTYSYTYIPFKNKD